MILMLIEPEKLPYDIGMIYEELSKASPRACNGMPIFMSMNMLNVDDATKVWKYVEEIQKFLKGFGEDNESSEDTKNGHVQSDVRQEHESNRCPETSDIESSDDSTRETRQSNK